MKMSGGFDKVMEELREINKSLGRISNNIRIINYDLFKIKNIVSIAPIISIFIVSIIFFILNII